MGSISDMKEVHINVSKYVYICNMYTYIDRHTLRKHTYTSAPMRMYVYVHVYIYICIIMRTNL